MRKDLIRVVNRVPIKDVVAKPLIIFIKILAIPIPILINSLVKSSVVMKENISCSGPSRRTCICCSLLVRRYSLRETGVGIVDRSVYLLDRPNGTEQPRLLAAD